MNADSGQFTRFELLDPRDGDIGVMYCRKTFAEMVVTADELGACGFQGLTALDTFVQFIKKDGRWQQVDPRVEEACWRAQRLTQTIQWAHKADMNRPDTMEEGVREAFAEMGMDPVKHASEQALQGISCRSIDYSEVMRLVAPSQHGIMADSVGVLSLEVSRLWAELDVREFRRILGASEIKAAAGFLRSNASANAGYGEAIIVLAPDVLPQRQENPAVARPARRNVAISPF